MALCKICVDGKLSPTIPSEIQEQDLVVLKITASWCGPCKRVQPIFAEECKKYENVCAYVLDTDLAQEGSDDEKKLLDALDVSALPTFIYFRNGIEVHRFAGSDEVTLRKAFREFCKPNKIDEQQSAVKK